MPAELVHSPKFSTEQVDRALLEMAVCGGNSEKASKRLRVEGLSVTGRTLRNWRERDYPRRYIELANQHRSKVEDVIVAGARESALKAAQLEHAALDQAIAQANDGELKDPTSAARNAAVTKGINVDTMLKTEGRPTQIVENRQAADVLRKLRASGAFEVIDGYAEAEPEDPAPQLPEAA